MKKKNHWKVISTNIYRGESKELEYEIFDQVIANLLLSGTIFTKSHSGSFYILNDDITIESFNNITHLQQDINGKENKAP